MSDEAVLDRFLPHLTRVNPRFDRSWVKAAHVFKAPYAQPIVGVGYRESLPPHRTPLAGRLAGEHGPRLPARSWPELQRDPRRRGRGPHPRRAARLTGPAISVCSHQR